MLNSLEIRNYRNLKHLTIEKLGRVNLVIGKNNTGKSSLLEAVSIWVSVHSEERRNIIGWISKLISVRDEEYRYEDEKGDWRQDNIRFFSSIFHGNNSSLFNEEQKITIGENEENLVNLDLKISYRDGYLLSEIDTNIVAPVIKIATSKAEIVDKDYDVEFLIYSKKANQSYSIESTKPGFKYLNLERAFSAPDNNCQYIKSTDIGRETDSELWGKIALLPTKEDAVLQSLRLLNKEIEQFTFVQEWGGIKPKIRFQNGKITYLKSMGDGINRILTIILAMVNCENGYLLIDEFENGLHYSVLEKLWEIIFKLAEQLNIQVFVTTHSNDAIRTFENVVNRNAENPVNGLLIKLDNIEGTIEATVFEPDELKFITDNFIEAR